MTANDWTAICDKPHDIRLIVADMDGTLLDGDSNIPDDFWPLLDELHAKGVEFVPASGRQLATLRSMFADRVDGAMSYIAENDTVVSANVLSPEEILAGMDAMGEKYRAQGGKLYSKASE